MLHGNRTYLLQDANGQIIETHSISAGLDYPGVGPEHAYLKDIGRAEYVGITDDEALAAFHDCAAPRASSRRWNRATRSPTRRSWRRRCARTSIILVNLSGRGDKDMGTVADLMGWNFD